MKPVNPKTDIQSTAPSDAKQKSKISVQKGDAQPPRAKSSSKKALKKSEKPITSRKSENTTKGNTVVPHNDIFYVLGPKLKTEDLQSLRGVNKASEALATDFLNVSINAEDLTPKGFFRKMEEAMSHVFGNEPAELLRSEEKQEFALSKNIRTTINVRTPEDIKKLNEFLADPVNRKYLKNIEKISVAATGKTSQNENAKQIQDLFNILAEKSDELSNLTSIEINQIIGTPGPGQDFINVPERLPAKLSTLMIRNMTDLTLNFPETLPDAFESINISFLVHSEVNFPQKFSAPGLKTISFYAIEGQTDINFPDKLSGNANGYSNPQCSISLGTIKSKSAMKGGGVPKINLPESLLGDLNSITYTRVEFPEIQQKLDEDIAKIEARP